MAAPLAPVKTHHLSTVEQSLNLLTPSLKRTVFPSQIHSHSSTVYLISSEVLSPLLLYPLQLKVDKNIYSEGQLWSK